MANLTIAELIARTQIKIETANTILQTKRTAADARRDQWRQLDEDCRKLEQQIVEWQALIAEAKVSA